MRKSTRSIREEKGQTLVEFALVLPILCVLLFGIIQFGTVFNNWVTLTDATRAGARKAVVSRGQSDPGAVAEDAVRDSAPNLNQDELEVDIAVSPKWENGAEVTVTASYPYTI